MPRGNVWQHTFLSRRYSSKGSAPPRPAGLRGRLLLLAALTASACAINLDQEIANPVPSTPAVYTDSAKYNLHFDVQHAFSAPLGKYAASLGRLDAQIRDAQDMWPACGIYLQWKWGVPGARQAYLSSTSVTHNGATFNPFDFVLPAGVYTGTTMPAPLDWWMRNYPKQNAGGQYVQVYVVGRVQRYDENGNLKELGGATLGGDVTDPYMWLNGTNISSISFNVDRTISHEMGHAMSLGDLKTSGHQGNLMWWQQPVGTSIYVSQCQAVRSRGVPYILIRRL